MPVAEVVDTTKFLRHHNLTFRKANTMAARFRIREEKEADSSILGTVLMLVIVLIVAAIAVLWAVPESQRKSLNNEFRSSVVQFDSMNANIKEVMMESLGSSTGASSTRTCRISVGTGDFLVRSNETIFVVSYTLSQNEGEVKFDYVYSSGYDYMTITNRTSTGAASYSPMKITYNWLNASESTTTVSVGSGVGTYTIDAEYPLVNTHFSVLDATNASRAPLAEAWVVTSDAIVHDIPSALGAYYVKSENCGVMTNYPGLADYVVRSPHAVNGSGRFALYFVKFDSNIASGQQGVYDLTFGAKAEGANFTSGVKNITIQAIGDYKDAWHDYFRRGFGFATDGSGVSLDAEVWQIDIYQFTIEMTVGLQAG